MFDVVYNIINHVWSDSGMIDQQIVYEVCGALIIVFSVTFIDLIYRIFSHFWRGKR